MPEWTFVTNYALVLSFLTKHPRATGRELATAIDRKSTRLNSSHTT